MAREDKERDDEDVRETINQRKEWETERRKEETDFCPKNLICKHIDDKRRVWKR